jgi:hypothetical protein
MIQMSADSLPVAKQFSYSKLAKAQEFAQYYREQMAIDRTPPKITDVQLVRTIEEFNCDNFTRGME